MSVPRIPGETELERLVNRSRLIGADATLVVHGGGNTSSKVQEVDHLGRERTVLRIKGSGTDLKTIGPDGFPGLFLDELLPLRERAAMGDEEMVAYLAHCMVNPGARRPSIETLLHAFLPARHVDHVHADAICALTNTPDAARHVREALGPDVALVPYIRPGFALSKHVAELDDAGAVVLEKHGLVTWGETHEASYQKTLELVARSEAYLAGRERPTCAMVPDLDDVAREDLLLTLRGLLSADGRRVLHLDRGQRALADRPDVALVAGLARATPDHILRIGAKSLVLAAPERAEESVADFVVNYHQYFARNQHRMPPGLSMLSPLPRVVLVPGLGAIAAGPDARTARVNAEIAARSHLVTARTLDTFGAIAWLSEEEIFDFDYWPLELFKLQTAPAPRPFSGHVAVITGAESVVGQAVATRLANDGAHLVLSGGIDESLSQLMTTFPSGTAVAAVGDPVSAAIAAYGGFDLLIALDTLSRERWNRVNASLHRQRLGGAIVGVHDGMGATVDLQHGVPNGVRINQVDTTGGSSPSQVAEAVAFLASARAAGIDRVSLPIRPVT